VLTKEVGRALVSHLRIPKRSGAVQLETAGSLPPHESRRSLQILHTSRRSLHDSRRSLHDSRRSLQSDPGSSHKKAPMPQVRLPCAVLDTVVARPCFLPAKTGLAELLSRLYCGAQGVQEGDLIVKEDREEGQIGSKVYLYYARAYGCVFALVHDSSGLFCVVTVIKSRHALVPSAGGCHCACWSCAGAQSRASTSSPTGTAFILMPSHECHDVISPCPGRWATVLSAAICSAGGYRSGLSQKQSDRLHKLWVRPPVNSAAATAKIYGRYTHMLLLLCAGLPYNSQRGRYIGGYFGFAMSFTSFTLLRSTINLFFALGEFLTWESLAVIIFAMAKTCSAFIWLKHIGVALLSTASFCTLQGPRARCIMRRSIAWSEHRSPSLTRPPSAAS